MKQKFYSYITSINNSIMAKAGKQVFSLEEAINEYYPILKEPFDSFKLFYDETVDINRDKLDESIYYSKEYLLKKQNQKGFWVAELEANTTLTSEYIMFMHYINKVNVVKQKKIVNHLIRTQQEDGGWNIYYGAPSDINTTCEAYFAMKLAGVDQEQHFMVRARELILKKGGVSKTRVFTKIFLALFGLYDWRGIPAMPAELILLPNSAYITIYEMSSWSRSVVVPLLIIFAKKPMRHLPDFCGIDELFLEDKDQIDYSFEMEKFELSWKTLFLACDTLLKLVGKSPIKPFRKAAIKKAEKWILDHQDKSGDWGGIMPAMMNSIIALRCLGYSNTHPVIEKGLKAIERFAIEDEDELRLQSCISPVWDTAYTAHALSLSGIPSDHPALVKSGQWLASKQIRQKGDWKIKNPDAIPGGWAFEFDNAHYPDTDDTAEVLIALNSTRLPDEKRKGDTIARGIKWLLSMQSTNGGWGAFDKDNDREILNQIPFSDLGALLDQPSPDVTGRILCLLGELGLTRDHESVEKAYQFLRLTQEEDGSWFGRWGVNYIYGTYLALAGLCSIGENMSQQHIYKAIDWLKAHQNHDGGWGETCKSYVDKNLKGIGVSTASQTSWALLGLFTAGEANSSSAKRGIKFLLDRQNADGTWDEKEFTGTGFPGHFYIRYHMYRDYFPLLALCEYKRNTIN